jgi:hypothetical protein
MTSMPESTWGQTTMLNTLLSDFVTWVTIISTIFGGIMCSNSRLFLTVPLPLMVELATAEANDVLLVCYALLLPTQVLISARTIALKAGVEFTVLLDAAKIGWST